MLISKKKGHRLSHRIMPAATSGDCRPLLYKHFHVNFADQLRRPGARTVARNPYTGRMFDTPVIDNQTVMF